MPKVEFSSAMRTHVGCRRKLNEDCVLSDSDRGIWAVADGMGGHAAGEVASAMVIDALGACHLTGSAMTDRGAVALALAEVNRRIFDLAGSGDEQLTIGSTVVGLLASDDGYVCFWAGDSRAYLLGSGQIRQITRDHSLVQDLVNVGMLSAAEAESHPNANVITRAVGVTENLEIDTVEGPVKAGDRFVVASDGLTRLVSSEEISSIVSGTSVDAAADRLLNLALERGAPDNVSLIVVETHP